MSNSVDNPTELLHCRCGLECGAATFDGGAWWSGGGRVGTGQAPDTVQGCPGCRPRDWTMRTREMVMLAGGEWVFADTWRSNGKDRAPAGRAPGARRVEAASRTTMRIVSP